MTESIATSSIAEGLDFAANLLASAIMFDSGEPSPQTRQQLQELAHYIQLRYVGETGLALEALVHLAHEYDAASFRSQQFWTQVRWLSNGMRLSSQEFEELRIPHA